MKKSNLIFIALLLAVIIMVTNCDNNPKPKEVKLNTYADSLSYAFGYLWGVDVAMIPFDFNLKMMYRGLINAADPTMELLTLEQIQDLWFRLSEDISDQFYDPDEDLFELEEIEEIEE